MMEGAKELLTARLEDAIVRMEGGEVVCLPFLTPREQKIAERHLRMRGRWEQAWLWGGYPTAERACAFLLPEYLIDCLSAPLHSCEAEELLALLDEDVQCAICAVRISGSGYRSLSHRDFLGAVLGLGIERDALGDLAVQNQREAVLFCSATLAEFLRTHLERVANDAVRVSSYIPDGNFTDGRQYRAIHDTVASERLDCVIAALCGLSREAAQSAIRSGTVEVDFEQTERVDTVLAPPVSLSVRGHGRFVLRSFDGTTKKGRLRLFAEQLI